MMILACLMIAVATADPTWSDEAAVRHGNDAVVRYQARIEDNYLIVKATHQKGWHTYAMDNEARALAALKGKMSLGIEKGIEITAENGLELEDSWLQSKPIDLSKPELRWFTYGFDQTAFFACPVKKLTSEDVTLRIKGQACSGETCCNVNVLLKLSALKSSIDTSAQANALPPNRLVKDLVPIQKQDDPANENP